MNNYEDIAKQKLEKVIVNLGDRFITIRTGRANPSMIDHVMVNYYGVPTPVRQVATVSVPEARQLNIKPFDKSLLGQIEKAIFEANLGLTPNNNGESVFITIPQLTEERRKELVKLAKEYSEEAKIAIRNIRRDLIETIKKDKLAEDVEDVQIQNIQKVIDSYNNSVENMLKEKEKDLMII